MVGLKKGGSPSILARCDRARLAAASLLAELHASMFSRSGFAFQSLLDYFAA